MELRDFLEQVKGLDPKTKIVFSHDKEGSWFSDTEELEIGLYDGEEFDTEDRHGNGQRAICLWPLE